MRRRFPHPALVLALFSPGGIHAKTGLPNPIRRHHPYEQGFKRPAQGAFAKRHHSAGVKKRRTRRSSLESVKTYALAAGTNYVNFSVVIPSSVFSICPVFT